MPTPSPTIRPRTRRHAGSPKARILPEPPARPAAAVGWWPWLALLAALAALVWLLTPILTPFLLGAVLAYIGNPLVARLQSWGVPRALSAVLVLSLAVLWLAMLLLIVIPLVRDEAASLSQRLPDALAQFNAVLAPRITAWTGITISLDPQWLQSLAVDNWDVVKPLLQRLYESVRIGGGALIGIVLNGLLAPVVAFYMLLERDALLARLEDLIPPRWRERTRQLAGDIDTMLAGFLRGQFLVMFALAAYYAVALTLVGLPSALPIGVLTGMLVFVPYIGYASGLLLALSVAVLQFAGWPLVLLVLAVYGIGQVIESFALTPYLVGERIGLSPLAAIFALMAFGQVFGFFGVLVALPAAAALVVAMRELRLAYVGSALYGSPR